MHPQHTGDKCFELLTSITVDRVPADSKGFTVQKYQ